MLDFMAPLIFLLLVFYLAYIAIIKEYLPNYIANQVKIAPIDKEIQYDLLKIHSLTEKGLKLSIKGTILDSKTQHKRLSILVKIPSIKVYFKNQLLGVLFLSNPVSCSGVKDVYLDQELEFEFSEDIGALLPTIRRISAIGPSELEKLKLVIKFKLTLEAPLFLLADIPCSKQVLVGDIGPKVPTIPGPIPQSLPKPFIRPFLGGIYAGLNIKFSSIPALQFSIDKIDFELFLNGHVVATCRIEKFEFLTQLEATIMIKITPMSTYRPITGSLSIAKGLVKGAINGIAQGVLFGEWGNKSMVPYLIGYNGQEYRRFT